MDKKDKEFYSRLKEIQKAHKPAKWEARNPYNWKKEWGPFVKYDADWDGAYLLDLIIYKLEKMYIALDVYSNEVRESLDPKLVKLKETIDLGKKLQTYKYDREYHDWGKIHCAHVVLVYKKGESLKGNPIHKFIYWYKPEEENEDKDYFEDYFREKEVKQWAKENGYDRKNLTIAYSGEWDDKENYKVWKKLSKKCQKEEQADIDKFFKLISRNYSQRW